jgi:RNA polymerase sigma factor (sigma-70 family)
LRYVTEVQFSGRKAAAQRSRQPGASRRTDEAARVPRRRGEAVAAMRSSGTEGRSGPVQILARAVAPRDGKTRPPRDPATLLLRAIAPDAPPIAAGAAFWTLWLAHRDELRRQSLRLSNGHRADAEDALSEAMLKAAQAFPRLELRNARAWLLRLVRNSCIDRHRERRRGERAAQDIGIDVEAIPAAAPRPPRTPEALLAARQDLSALRSALGALPPLLAEPLRLHLDERPDGEIAGRLGITREVVRKRRQMARDFLRRRVGADAAPISRAGNSAASPLPAR